MAETTMTTKDRVDRILREAVGRDLSSWERYDFLPNVAKFNTPTSRQDEILRGIEKRIFGEEDDGQE